MKKYVVVSTNNNPDYYFYLPYIERAWNSYGWDVCCMITDDVNIDNLRYSNPKTVIIRLPNIEGLRTESIAQAGRLYAANYFDENVLLMTSDIDLLPLSDYWKPKYIDCTVYGHDLTWHSFYPMGYIAMRGMEWKHKMGLSETKSDMLRDAKEFEHLAYAPDWEQWWNWDWTMITARLKPYAEHITFIDRGQINIAGATLAKGRVDRYNWEETQKQPDWIDAHCENNNVQHPDKLNKFLSVFEKVHGKLIFYSDLNGI